MTAPQQAGRDHTARGEVVSTECSGCVPDGASAQSGSRGRTWSCDGVISGFTPGIQAKERIPGTPRVSSLILTPRAPSPRSQVVLTFSAPLRLRVRSRILSTRRGSIPPGHSDSAHAVFHERLTQRRSDAEGLILVGALIDTGSPSSLGAVGESKAISPRTQRCTWERGDWLPRSERRFSQMPRGAAGRGDEAGKGVPEGLGKRAANPGAGNGCEKA